MPDPLSLSAREAAREIAAGRLRAETLAAACLERIAAREAFQNMLAYLQHARIDAEDSVALGSSVLGDGALL